MKSLVAVFLLAQASAFNPDSFAKDLQKKANKAKDAEKEMEEVELGLNWGMPEGWCSDGIDKIVKTENSVHFY